MPLPTIENTTRSGYVPKQTKFAWGLSGIADTFLTYGLGALVMPIYNIGYGVDAVLLGYALSVPRLIDALTDPIMGIISDNTRSRWGRRRPYIFIGILLAAILFPLIWIPPTDDNTGRFIWFASTMVLMTLVYTIFSVPTMALGYEFTSDYDEKTRVMAWRGYLSIFAGLSVQWLYMLLVLPQFGGSEAEGIIYIGPVIGLIILITGLPAAIFCKEKVSVISQPKVKLLEAFGLTLKNRGFIILMAGYILIVSAGSTVGSLGLYINIHYVCGGDKVMAGTIGGIFGTVMIGAAVLSMWMIGKISQWTSKRTGLMIGLALSIFGNFSLWFTMQPQTPWLQYISAFFIGLGGQGCWLMIDSMVADTCDDDEVRSGLRREGTYSAAKGFSSKIALTVTAVLAGYVLAFSGYQEGVAPSVEITLRMKLLLVGVNCTGLAMALFFFCFYPLSRQKMAENQRILAERQMNKS